SGSTLSAFRLHAGSARKSDCRQRLPAGSTGAKLQKRWVESFSRVTRRRPDDMKERILVADDERELRDILVGFLRGEGYEVDGFEDGEAALAALRGTPYDLVLTDLRMPRLDGVGLLKEALEIYPDILVIVMTGFATIESAVDAMRLGAYDYLAKPVRIAEL